MSSIQPSQKAKIEITGGITYKQEQMTRLHIKEGRKQEVAGFTCCRKPIRYAHVKEEQVFPGFTCKRS